MTVYFQDMQLPNVMVYAFFNRALLPSTQIYMLHTMKQLPLETI